MQPKPPTWNIRRIAGTRANTSTHAMNRNYLMATVSALTLALFCFTAYAKKPDNPGGGGGSDGAPAGIVYFHHDGDVSSMNADGSNRVRWPLVTLGDRSFSARNAHPSYFVHDDQRWFVRIVPDLVGPGFEVRGISESGTSALLFTSADADIISPPIWTPDDLSVSFIGQRWMLNDSGETVIADAGLYTVDVSVIGRTAARSSTTSIATPAKR